MAHAASAVVIPNKILRCLRMSHLIEKGRKENGIRP
jgi:hypothetical protein